MKTEKVTKDVWIVVNRDTDQVEKFHNQSGAFSFAEASPGWTALKATLTYEVPREPLRWEGEMTIDAALSARLWFCSFVTKEGTQTNDIEPFIGKRTRVTIEEVE